MTYEEVIARCAAEKLGPSACAELVEPLCDGRGVLIEFGKPPRCLAGEGSARKAAIELRETLASVRTPVSPWLIVGGALGLGLLVYFAVR